MNLKVKQPKLDHAMFWPPLLILLAACYFLIKDVDKSNQVLNAIFAFLTGPLGWFFLWSAVISLVVLAYLAIGKYGNIRFGDKPEFSTWSWLGMIFTAGAGSSIIYWGTIEWAYYITSPPWGAEPFSGEAVRWATSYGMFHWGTHAWGYYVLCGIPFAYFMFNRKVSVIRPSAACRELLGNRVDGWLGKLIDILFIFGLIGGVGTTMGLATPMVSAALTSIFGIPNSNLVDSLIILAFGTFLSIGLAFGLQKGLQKLSDIRVFMAAILLAFLLFAGPTGFILNTFTDSVGWIIQNTARMSFWTDSYAESGFPQGWTIFMWAWWLAFTIPFGIFLARISKGRTLKEFIIGAMSVGTLGSWIFYAVQGDFALYLQKTGALNVTDIMNESGAAVAIIEIFKAAPLGNIFMPLMILLAILSLVTSLNSCAYTIAMTTTKEITGDMEPARWLRVVWAMLLGALAIGLLNLGGLKPLQSSSLIVATPLVLVVVILVLSGLKAMNKDLDQKDVISSAKVEGQVTKDVSIPS